MARERVFLLAVFLASGARAEGATPAADEAANILPELVISTGTPLQAKMNELDQKRDEIILPKTGASSYGFDSKAIEALPQGADTPLDKVLLQAPGVAADSALSYPDFHIRNEYANVQYRINGILLPEGIAGLGSVLETNFAGNLNLLTGVLPAQYGLRTAGVVDLTTKSQFAIGGSAGLYGGSFGTISPRFDYGGSFGTTQYFATGRFTQNTLGLESATPAANPIHDRTDRGKFFGYISSLLGDSNRLSFMTGASINQFQIPNIPGQTPLGDFGGLGANSSVLNERQNESFLFNVLALQSSTPNFDSQIALFSRYATSHFVPDVSGDLAFNDVASNISRESLLNGVQGDGSYRWNDIHTLRAGFGMTAEQTRVNDTSTVLPLDAGGVPLPAPFTLLDANAKLGWNLGAYVQDEWKLTDKLTLNTGLRFDQLYQFVSANQLSPRAALVYKFNPETSIHAGYARYFTPPSQVEATPVNTAIFAGTTQQPVVPGTDPARPERSHYFDVGLDHTFWPGLEGGIDVYYKRATNVLDDGQFGQAALLTQFNYAQGYSQGLELKVKYHNDNVRAYANFSTNRTKAKNVISNQYLFDDPAELAFIAANYHFMDDVQLITASAGASYLWNKTLFSIDGIYGSGLRSGFANLDHVQAYATFNLGISHEFDTGIAGKPVTARFDVVNLLDTLYVLRDGTGIGEFAPQYGARRGFFMSVSQKL